MKEDSLLSSDSDEVQPKKIKSQPKQDHVEKFKLLQEKRLKIKDKQEKKLAKKYLKNEKSPIQSVVPNNTNFSLNQNGVLLKNSSIKSLERKIDSALSDANIDAAEKLSDELFAKESELKMNKEREKLEYGQAKSLLLNDTHKKRRLNWKFEAKQRWESKSNM